MADTIALMRKRVLDMAIRGELVEQRPEEGTGKELYRDIEQEKDQLMKSGKIKKEKKFPLVSKKEEPFEIPINWTWVRLGSLTAAEDDSFSDGPFGSNLKTIHYTENPEVRIIQLNNVGEGIWKDKVRKYTTYQHAAVLKRYNIKPGDMVIAKMMPAGRTIIVPEVEDRYIVSSDNVKFVPNKKVNSTYIMHTVNSSTIRQMIVNTSTGTTRVRTSSSKLKNLFVPLPPLAEQKRIVAKIKDIFAVIDQIGTKKEEALSIIRNMRQAALQDAIRGLLVEQDERDEPASELFKKIHFEKEQMVKSGNVKKPKPLKLSAENENEYGIPLNWEWVKLDDIAVINRGASPRPIKAFITEDEDGVNWVKIGDSVRGKKYIDSVNQKITPDGAKKSIYVSKGDLIMSNSMSFGYAYIMNTDGCIHDGWLSFKLPKELIDVNWMHYMLNANYDNFEKLAVGTGVRNLNIDRVRSVYVGLPPLAEQERIVAKLDEITAICDQLAAILDGSTR